VVHAVGRWGCEGQPLQVFVGGLGVSEPA
jgi:hypothetical protein